MSRNSPQVAGSVTGSEDTTTVHITPDTGAHPVEHSGEGSDHLVSDQNVRSGARLRKQNCSGTCKALSQSSSFAQYEKSVSVTERPGLSQLQIRAWF
jgi:hypothetical protein